MKIEQSVSKKIVISEVKNLDPVTVFLEDFKPRHGRITINCYNKSWNSYWGGMGDRTISDFFISCDNHYLAKNLSSISSTVNDYDSLGEKIKNFYGEDIEWDTKNEIESMGDYGEWHIWVENNSDIMRECFGQDWYFDIPQKTNYEYDYLCRIIDVVREALKTLKELETSEE